MWPGWLHFSHQYVGVGCEHTVMPRAVLQLLGALPTPFRRPLKPPLLVVGVGVG